MTIHHLTIAIDHLHGYFSADLSPALTIASGDTVIFETLSAGWHIAPGHPLNQSDNLVRFAMPHPEEHRGHALTGPVSIEGAEPGMTLAIRVDALQLARKGWNVAGGWHSPVNDRLGLSDVVERRYDWTLDETRAFATNQLGTRVRMQPFLGVMGMPPAEPGRHSTVPPRVTGGNIDCRELVVGSTLYLPIAVKGGLFSTGDGHGAQGDGELSQTAIEIPMERAELTFSLLPDLHITTPRANTPAGWVTFGFATDLFEAGMIATNAMLDLMGELYGYDRQDALAVASVAVHLRVTQVVNGGMWGMHALLPHDAIG